MIDLREYRQSAAGLEDYVPWCVMIEDGIILNHDGSLQQSFRYRGPDMDSSTEDELVVTVARLNNCLRRIGGNWCIQTEARRERSQVYPARRFPDVCTALIDSERMACFADSGNYFESVYYFTLLYLPPKDKYDKFGKLFIDEKEVTDSEHDRVEMNLRQFKTEVQRVYQLFAEVMPECHALNAEETLTYLHSCVSPKYHTVKPAACYEFLNNALIDTPLHGGLHPKLGDYHLGILSINGFPPQSTPGILDALNRLGFEYRWVTRYLPADKVTARTEIENYRRQWFASRKSIWTQLKEALTRSESAMVDTDALERYDDAQEALRELSDDLVSFGKYTQVLVVMDKSREKVDAMVRQLEKTINARGFTTIHETTNAVNAWMSSIPCMPRNNIRKYYMSSLNLAHMFPLSAVWAGEAWNRHLDAPPLMRCQTSGSTPFRFNLHVGDVGHTMVVGITGSGKSVFLNTVEAQFRGYKDAQVYIFDKGGSSRALTAGVGGTFYDLGNEDEDSISFQPLAHIDRENERNWAMEWILQILLQEGIPAITPSDKAEVWSALNKLATAPESERTMTGLCLMLQDERLRDALKIFTTASVSNPEGGAYGRLFDSEHDSLTYGNWQVFEMEELMQKRSAVMPTLQYIFHRLEQNCTGRPTIIVLDECWVFLDNPLFSSKIREWLKVMRKNNVSIVFATQNLEDIARSQIAPAIIESCQTDIFLPNPSATNASNDTIYGMFNLNEKERWIIATATQKRQYYYKSHRNSRLFELGLDRTPFTLAYVASASKEDQQKVRELLHTYPQDEFNEHWMHYKGMPDVCAVIQNLKHGKEATS